MESKSSEPLTIGQLASKSSIEKVVLPAYPVIDREPSNSLTLANFRFSDYVKAIAIPSVMTTAYYIGTLSESLMFNIIYNTLYNNIQIGRHKVTTAVWAAISFPAIYFMQYDNVQQRLKGFRENEAECQKNDQQPIKV
ncbi:putative transmembrane protein [Heterostelium album PN500]|uniref:Putative transmembrane protein n=1 Tax=Heterostelium pallidum (strain ATCC 26659 / Pp 5 / PN500) TaxID=670386 RepID=D3AZW5_HETP5|nr:putative transmembrane protein [Heterostelium album PN500]EFA84589.1 putative transmembrane protein [Heterostelium album PN500]|eukprot:XP_020436702.1 putative transmembrane protein [Heterostelium album PN500]